MSLTFKRLKSNETFLSAALILLVAAITYLPLAAQLGFYHDDWHPIAGEMSNTWLVKMFAIDRPFMGVFYWLTHLVLGDQPILWHLYAFAVRMVGAFAFFWLLRMLWPKQRLATTLMVLIFIVYPGFLQEPSANTFQNQFLGFSMGILSLAFTVRALKSQSPRAVFWLTALAALFELGYFAIYEYMIGLEGVRLLLIGYLLPKEAGARLKEKLIAVAKRWWPYIPAILLLLVFRGFIFHSARPAMDVGALVGQYRQDPGGMLLRLVLEEGKDFVETIFVAWFLPFENLLIITSNSDLILAVLLALAGVGLVLFYVRWLRRQGLAGEEDESGDRSWLRSAMGMGAIGVAALLFPVILSGRNVDFRSGFDRYTLQATLSMAMLVVGFILYTMRSRWRTWTLLFLIGIAIVTQVFNAASYRTFWNYQRQLWWQMSWRVPQMQQGTVLMALLPQGYRLGEDFEIWAPANMIYAPDPGTLWVVSEVLNSDTAKQVIYGESNHRSFRNINFDRNFQNALILSMPSSATCLHVIDGKAPEVSASDDPLVSLVAPYSRADLIEANAPLKTPPALVFGQEPPHTWCYYYQKMELARQQGNWTEAASLADQAASQGYQPADTSEWLPVFQGYANTGQTEKANRVADAIRQDVPVQLGYCQNFDLAAGSASQAAADYMRTALCTGN